MTATGIDYLDATWNPVTGCTHISEGCRNCWAERTAKRQHQEWGKVVLHPERLDQPLHWRKPRRVGVCFMGDLFHRDVPLGFILDVLQVTRIAEQHSYYFLTKRPDRFASIKNYLGGKDNVWLGVSVEDQKTANERIPILLQTPAAHRWVSIEPMLGPVDLVRWLPITYSGPSGYSLVEHEASDFGPMCFPDWVVLGGESGSGARPMHPDWVRSVRDQCVAAGVPFWFKQWGDYRETGCGLAGHPMHDAGWRPAKNGGRALDGRTWEDLP